VRARLNHAARVQHVDHVSLHDGGAVGSLDFPRPLDALVTTNHARITVTARPAGVSAAALAVRWLIGG